MAIASFSATAVAHLARLSIAHPEHRLPNITQRYSLAFLRDALGEARRKELEAGAEEGINMEINQDDLDFRKLPAGIWIVGDEGVYIMSNIDSRTPDLILEPFERVVQCRETDLRNCRSREEQYRGKRRIFGGDDGVEFLPADFILAACQGQDTLFLDSGRDGIAIASPASVKAWRRVVNSFGIPHFFDPDKKAPPELWRSPTSKPSQEGPR
ncbi:DUF3085 domain-containing protein [Paracoccus litorisediminis]|uniref:DUF3085 domain-containing protein n=1 Tax=Paracoccus litorisediminis TaxID=2006130 RepID=UPI0037336783